MNRFSVVCIACVLAALVPAVRAADDPVRDKLNRAKAAYNASMEKFRAAVALWCDQREEAARKTGDKKTVDQVKAERRAFEEKGELPKSAPAAVKTQLASARSSLEAAYKAAISEYTKTKMDDQAAAVEKELAEFKLGSPATPLSLEERIVGKVWSTRKGAYEFKPGGTLFINGKKSGHWAVIGTDRVVSVLDAGQYYDVYVFDKEFTSFQANYVGQPRKDAGLVGRAVRSK